MQLENGETHPPTVVRWQQWPPETAWSTGPDPAQVEGQESPCRGCSHSPRMAMGFSQHTAGPTHGRPLQAVPQAPTTQFTSQERLECQTRSMHLSTVLTRPAAGCSSPRPPQVLCSAPPITSQLPRSTRSPAASAMPTRAAAGCRLLMLHLRLPPCAALGALQNHIKFSTSM